ncbi:hypothetical protein HF325_005033 [Metschnikowia pulcherrima]|uniref:HAT C-terminal dimerisation domain-containing protein n=1 Tax=Metschnikowia pulcherrima TaxID=27326 RepID=A0A8H7L9H4_9ASCO|nr:hypothetical protein HF325_005033 [Metschnikowia pulcherrima]
MDDLQDPGLPPYELPDFESSPLVVRQKLFTMSLLPLPQSQSANVRRKFLLKCTKCAFSKEVELPPNSTNLRVHWKNHHFDVYTTRIQEYNQKNGIINPQTRNVSSSSTILQYVASGGGDTPRNVTYGQQLVEPQEFDPPYYKGLMMRYILKENLPFTTADSSELQQLLNHARLCKDPHLPKMSRYIMKNELSNIYQLEKERLKAELDKMKGRVAITLDEWKSGNSLDFLGVTLHLHDEAFRLQNHVIGFEVLNLKTSYTGEVLYDYLKNVLDDYGIKNRLVSITRDNATPIDILVQKYAEEIAKGCTPLGFDGDIRCVGHVLNLVTGAILNYTFFKPKKSDYTRDKIKELEELYPDHVRAVRETAELVFSLIHGVRKTTFVRNTFASINAKSFNGPRTLIKGNETRWLSTLHMLERFLFFREELLQLLEVVKLEPKFKQKGYKLKSLSISEFDWDYIGTVYEILKGFEFRVKKLQGSNYQTASSTIPYVAQISMMLEEINDSEFKRSQPLLTLGLLDACDKILKYYNIRGSTIEPLKHLYLATVLDPRLKLKTLRDLSFSSTIIDAVEKHFYEVFYKYKREHDKNKRVLNQTKKRRKTSNNIQNASRYEKDIFTVEEITTLNNEVTQYLSEPRQAPECNIGQFYRLRRDMFPVIFEMARDYLCTPAMSAPAESLFSQVKCIVTDKRHNALPGMIKMLAILKSRGVIPEPACDFIDHHANTDAPAGSTENPSLVDEAIHVQGSDPGGAFDGLEIHTDAFFSDDEIDENDERNEADLDAEEICNLDV